MGVGRCADHRRQRRRRGGVQHSGIRFHGLVRGPESKTSHAKLRITDLSDNGFAGKLPLKQLVSQATNSKERFPIPSDYLKGLRTLNLSNNSLIRLIPPSLENLMELESLNLSDNKLPGEIPQQLTLLTFLSFLNVFEFIVQKLHALRKPKTNIQILQQCSSNIQ
ncbi:hypothetical protein RJ639_036343, partial [Escallonia herrerae]